MLQTGQITYNWQITSFTAPPKEKLVIYEILIRDFTANRDIKTITDTLPYLKRLGINAIELMPFNEFEGNESWGYNPSFYFAPDKAYGTKNDYKKFIDECHKNGVAVIMDLVLNHSYSQSPLVRMYMDGGKPSVNNPWYNRDYNMQNPDAQYGFDFNHESIYTQKLVDSITSFWLTEYKLDGFRFDFTKGFTNTAYGPTSWASDYDASRIAILKQIATQIWKQKSGALIIFEHLAVNQEEKELADFGILLWGNMNGAYNEATMGYNENNKSDFSWISHKNRGWSNPNVIGYMESHDEERLMFKNITYGNATSTYNIKDPSIALKRVGMAAAFFFTVPGPKMIWQFGELGYDISINEGGRLAAKPVKWNYYLEPERRKLYNTFKALINLKTSDSLFSTKDFTMNVSGALKSIELSSGSDKAVVIGNFGVTATNSNYNFPNSGKWYEFFSGDSISMTATSFQLNLQPGEYKLFSTRKLAGSGSLVTGLPNYSSLARTKVFPNPCKNELTIESTRKIEKIIISSITGSKEIENYNTPEKISTINLLPGVHLLQVHFKNKETEVYKIIKH